MNAIEVQPHPEIDALLESKIQAGDFPSAVYLVANANGPVFTSAIGYAVVSPAKIPATLQTIYDLASLTKPLITSMLCARLIEDQKFNLKTPVSQFLPSFRRSDKDSITVGQLVSHTSGLPPWRPLYLLATGKPDVVLSVIADEPLLNPPGTHVAYSDLGFITLGYLIQAATGISFSQYARSLIFEPLKLQNSFFTPHDVDRSRLAATETGNEYEKQMAGNHLHSVGDHKWRHEVVWGEVHDGNAYFLGGAAGHAGLFSDASDTLTLARQFLARSSRLLRAETCALFTQNLSVGLEESRSLGWQLAATPDSTAGPDLPPNAFGHTGFTGTCCWIDPLEENIYILLTNRVHNRQLPFANINSTRRRFNSIAATALARCNNLNP